MKYITRLLVVCSCAFSILSLYAPISLATGPRVSASLFVAPKNVVNTLDFHPFIDSNELGQGVVVELLNSIFKEAGIEAVVNILPSHNMVKYYFSEEKSLAMLSYENNLSEQERSASIFIPLLSFDEYYFYYKPAFNQGFIGTQDLSDLQGKVYGAHKGDNINGYRKSGVNIYYARLHSLLKKMRTKEVDFIRQPALTLDFLIKEDAAAYQADDFIRMTEPAGKNILGIAFNKRHAQGAVFAKKFQQAMDVLWNKGELKSIFQYYLGSEVNADAYFLYKP